MTKAQQVATRNLAQALEDYLYAYGWRREGSFWKHPKVNSSAPVTAWDALVLTRAEPRLGWPLPFPVKPCIL